MQTDKAIPWPPKSFKDKPNANMKIEDAIGKENSIHYVMLLALVRDLQKSQTAEQRNSMHTVWSV